VTLYRGVYPVPFDITHIQPERLYTSIFEHLLARKLVASGDLVILTKGELSGVSGGTNAMLILKVTAG
jgi:pyruvate kinase